MNRCACLCFFVSLPVATHSCQLIKSYFCCGIIMPCYVIVFIPVFRYADLNELREMRDTSAALYNHSTTILGAGRCWMPGWGVVRWHQHWQICTCDEIHQREQEEGGIDREKAANVYLDRVRLSSGQEAALRKISSWIWEMFAGCWDWIKGRLTI